MWAERLEEERKNKEKRLTQSPFVNLSEQSLIAC